MAPCTLILFHWNMFDLSHVPVTVDATRVPENLWNNCSQGQCRPGRSYGIEQAPSDPKWRTAHTLAKNGTQLRKDKRKGPNDHPVRVNLAFESTPSALNTRRSYQGSVQESHLPQTIWPPKRGLTYHGDEHLGPSPRHRSLLGKRSNLYR